MSSTPIPTAAASILVVDDLKQSRELLTTLLERRGFRVQSVASGKMALQAAGQNPPDLVLLDIDMPEMNGYEVCERLKADANLRAIPIIFVSAMEAPGVKVWGFGVGGVDYVTKPFHFEELEARVRTHLDLARLRRELAQHSARLEEAVAQRTGELAETKARLAILNQAKSDFLCLIAREVRTPLGGILAATEHLLATYGKDPKALEYAVIYQESRRRLMTLIDDALLLTQIGVGAEAGAQNQCRLENLLNDARTLAAPLAESRAVELAPAPHGLGQVQGAGSFLVRALQSLLETAVKFAGAGTTVRLTQETTAGAISLVMEADGRAIPPPALPRFFHLLAIAEPSMVGDDLGLAPALAERIVTLYGGAVSVENLEPPGIRLTVRLRTPSSGPQ